MDHKELQERLKKLGISIPHGTLTRWASQGLIPGPSQYFKKRERRRGRPNKKLERLQGSRGRFMDWPDEAVESAAAIWALRNRPESTSGEQVAVSPRKGKRNVPNETVMWVMQEGKNLHNFLETDCKAASLFLRTLLDEKGIKVVRDDKTIVSRLLDFEGDILYPLIVLWITTIEKARRRIPLSKQLHLSYSWVIRENGQTSLKELFTSDRYGGIELKVTHLNPMQNGFSMDYGFPQVDLFLDQGFENIFELGGRQWTERFRIYSTGGPYEELSDESDPEGYAHRWAELEYGDFY